MGEARPATSIVCSPAQGLSLSASLSLSFVGRMKDGGLLKSSLLTDFLFQP